MILNQLILNQVKELETNNIGDLSSVSALLVETKFSMKDSGGINLLSLREELRKKSIEIFSNYYSNLNKPNSFFESSIIDGVELLPNGNTVNLERVEFINLGEEECELVEFKKVYFIPLQDLESPTNENLTEEDGSGGAPDERNRAILSRVSLEICNFSDFKSKVNFIQNFMKINFLALQQPKNNEFVTGINFRKFSIKKNKLNKFADLLERVVESGEFNAIGGKKRIKENVVVYFSNNYQTVARITFKNSNTGQEREVFQQTEGQFRAGIYGAFNDARVNFYIKDFDSIYPDLAAATFKREKINFKSLIRRNFLAPGVSIEVNDCMSQSFDRNDSSAAVLSKRLKRTLKNMAVKEARSLLEEGVFKTAEDLAAESGLLESQNIQRTMRKKLKQEFVVEGRSIVKETKEFFSDLSTFGFGPDANKKRLNSLGRFANSIEWQQILVIAAASIASRYGIDEILDEKFIKKQLAERISKHFTGERALRQMMDKLGPTELQAVAAFLSVAMLEADSGSSNEEREERRRRRDLDERYVPGEQLAIEDAVESSSGLGNVLNTSVDEREMPGADSGSSSEEREERRSRRDLDEREMLADTFQVSEFTASLREIEEAIEGAVESSPALANIFNTDASDMIPEEERNRRRLVELSRSSVNIDTREFKEEIINLIVNLSNCDRQNNAELYTKLIMFLIEELGSPVFDYFDEWSEYLNSWDIKNLDFCNLPDLNIPDFKLFPIKITIPEINFLDIFKFILKLILAILFGLLLKLIQSIINFILSLIPDFIFDFEPCEFANALRDFGQVLKGAICDLINGAGNLEDRLASIGCKILDAQTSNQTNNRDLVSFFKDGCRNGILPGSTLVDLLNGEASEETIIRSSEYFKALGNTDLADKITNNPEILSQAGGAIGSVIDIAELLDSLDTFEQAFPGGGLSSNGFIANLDLCSDPEVSDILDQLCTEPNPELRQQLADILEKQRESDREDAAKIVGFLTNPNRLAQEIENQIPNLAHPSLVIPGLVRDGQFDQIPVVKNSPTFALGRDEQLLLDLNTQSIRTNLESLDSCISSYGSSLITRSNNYKNKVQKRNRLIAKINSLGFTPPEPYETTFNLTFNFENNKNQIISKVFKNDFFIVDSMPEEARLYTKNLIEQLPESKQTSDKLSFEIGESFFKESVHAPLSQDFIKSDTNPEKILISSIFSLDDYSLFDPRKIRNGLLVEQALNTTIQEGNIEINLNDLSIKMKRTGEAIITKSLSNKVKNIGLDLNDELLESVQAENEEIERDSEEELDFVFNGVTSLLPTEQQEEIIQNYLTGDFEQRKTYKRFIEGLPQYSNLLLAKTDSELATIKQTIKTIINSIVLEEAHIRSSLLLGNLSEHPFALNDTDTAVYNLSTLNYNVEDKINLNYSDFTVKFFETTISGYNAVSYYLYEIEKITGNLAAVSNSLGRIATPRDLMNIEINKAVEDINRGFGGDFGDFSGPNLATSKIEGGASSSSLIMHFNTPSFYSSTLKDSEIQGLLRRSAKNNQKNMFLTSNLSFEVTLKPESQFFDTIQNLTLEQINQSAPSDQDETNLFFRRRNKIALKTKILNSLKEGSSILLGYDDLFSNNFNLSEDKNPLMASIFYFGSMAFSENGQGADAFINFIFENFTIKPIYKVFATSLTREVENFEQERVLFGTLIASELRSSGLFKNQEIYSTVFASNSNRTFDSQLGEGRQVEGAGFVFVELASFEAEALNRENRREFESKYFLLIRRLMGTNNNSQLAQDFKKNPSINILLSCLVPYSNIINEATSYVLEQAINELEGPGSRLLLPVQEQTKTTKLVSKSILSNVQ